MQNQINQVPYYPQGAYSQPASSVGAVNIQIFSPTANAQPGFYQAVPCGAYPCNYNNMINQYAPADVQNQQYPVPAANQNGQIDPSANQAMNLNNNNTGVAAQGQGEEDKKTEEKQKKQTVTLTDDYIRTLENYLNSQDKKVRLTGAKELLERFKEDDSRKDDAALTALLNKTLQDPADTVKFIGLTALDTGYAAGNDETIQILQQIQSSDSNYGEDASLAARILLKMSGSKANADAAALQNTQQNAQATDLPQNLQMTSSLQSVDKLPSDNSGILQNGGMSMNAEQTDKAAAQ